LPQLWSLTNKWPACAFHREAQLQPAADWHFWRSLWTSMLCLITTFGKRMVDDSFWSCWFQVFLVLSRKLSELKGKSARNRLVCLAFLIFPALKPTRDEIQWVTVTLFGWEKRMVHTINRKFFSFGCKLFHMGNYFGCYFLDCLQ
jgi:hypothetical protein